MSTMCGFPLLGDPVTPRPAHKRRYTVVCRGDYRTFHTTLPAAWDQAREEAESGYWIPQIWAHTPQGRDVLIADWKDTY